MSDSSFDRRRFLKTAATASLAAVVLGRAPAAQAQRAPIGTVLDYSAGTPSGASVKAAGHLGAVRYVSRPRPGAEWMLGKPVSLAETTDFKACGLATASVYQFGRAETADWLGGAASAAIHAPQAIELHRAAGGPTGRPIYIAIDDNPTRSQYEGQIRPYLKAFSIALTVAGYATGVYGNYDTLQWAIEDGIGSFFWMHDWGSGGRVHPRAEIHQVSGRQTTIDGIQCDVNNVFAKDWGQWTPGSTGFAEPTAEQLLADIPLEQLISGSAELSSEIPQLRGLLPR